MYIHTSQANTDWPHHERGGRYNQARGAKKGYGLLLQQL